jgi:hypothetical protein
LNAALPAFLDNGHAANVHFVYASEMLSACGDGARRGWHGTESRDRIRQSGKPSVFKLSPTCWLGHSLAEVLSWRSASFCTLGQCSTLAVFLRNGPDVHLLSHSTIRQIGGAHRRTNRIAICSRCYPSQSADVPCPRQSAGGDMHVPGIVWFGLGMYAADTCYPPLSETSSFP